MHPARIAELLAPFLRSLNASISLEHCHSEERSDAEPAVLSPSQLQSISTYIDILLRWNARINLTAIRDPEQIVTRHFGESLFAARHLFPRRACVGPGLRPGHAERSSAPATLTDIGSAPAAEWRQNAAYGASRGSDPTREQAPEGRKIPTSTQTHQLSVPPAANDLQPTTYDRITLADVGSGPGFPGIPIKLWAPQISLTLIESNHKKATFLREIARALTLTDINILTARADQVRQSFDVVTLRAVEHFPQILPAAAALVAPRGRLALLIGSSQLSEVQSTLPTFTWPRPTRIPQSKSRILLTGTQEPQK